MENSAVAVVTVEQTEFAVEDEGSSQDEPGQNTAETSYSITVYQDFSSDEITAGDVGESCGDWLPSDISESSGCGDHETPNPDQSYVCSICQASFSVKRDLKTHSLIHQGTDTFYTCLVCQGSFSSKVELKRHRRSHQTLTSSPEESDSLLDTLQGQPVLQTDSSLYYCHICGIPFAMLRTLTRHVRNHSENVTYNCQTCDLHFTSKQGLVTHRRVHEQKEPLVCEVCGQEFATSNSLYLHTASHGRDELRSHDEKEVDSPSGEGKSNETATQSQEGHVCSFCQKAFPTLFRLRLHLRTHTGEKPYSCKFCQWSFSTNSKMKDHERRHTGNLFSCDVCLKSFTMKSALKTHSVTHVQQPQRCKLCGKTFATKKELHFHNCSNEGGKRPFICRVCGKTFVNSSGLKVHSISHTMELLPFNRTKPQASSRS